ncbi:unannotated protein [freshwater metagenome]|uniref:Unannotated protein n=1 Tax=freshwater metagenome TaxID=449393 RepID=A0A6J6DBX3_9ZZZZ
MLGQELISAIRSTHRTDGARATRVLRDPTGQVINISINRHPALCRGVALGNICERVTGLGLSGRG